MLSEEERRRLEKLEHDLAATDPDLDLALQSGRPQGASARGYGILTALAGFALVIAGIMTQLTILGVIGFLLMVVGAQWFLNGFHLPDQSGIASGRHHDGNSSPSGA